MACDPSDSVDGTFGWSTRNHPKQEQTGMSNIDYLGAEVLKAIREMSRQDLADQLDHGFTRYATEPTDILRYYDAVHAEPPTDNADPLVAMDAALESNPYLLPPGFVAFTSNSEPLIIQADLVCSVEGSEGKSIITMTSDGCVMTTEVDQPFIEVLCALSEREVVF